jgi:predicted ATP-binding protein involved in virulence/Leucine-rich repeat (LRR) protein
MAMSISFTVATSLGAALSKFLLRKYLGDEGGVLGEALTDVGKKKIQDAIDHREATRQFEDIADRIVRKLRESFQEAGAGQASLDVEAVARELAATLDGRVSAEFFQQGDLDPVRLSGAFRRARPLPEGALGGRETELYYRALEEAVRYVVEIAASLPKFDQTFIAQSLQRLRYLGDDLEQVLVSVKNIEKRVEAGRGDVQQRRFEVDYRLAVLRHLDKVELFGVDISPEARRNLLTEAFVLLNVSGPAEDEAGLRSFEAVLDGLPPRAGRLLIRGSAGGGKTTLLRWAAIQAATAGDDRREDRGLWERSDDVPRPFDRMAPGDGEERARPGSGWRRRIPFLILLRKCQDGRLPAPDEFPGAMAREVSQPPVDWVASILKAGRGLVLLDGVDEIPNANRSAILDEIHAIIAAYPDNHFVLTTRPEAVPVGWLDGLGFREAAVSPMSVHDTARFIRKWHDAVARKLARGGRPTSDLEDLASDLLAKLHENASLAPLASNPLLCAMICALHRERYAKLPEGLRELCEALCHMLLHRRERESWLDWTQFPQAYRELSYGQKRGIVQELARFMVLEDRSALPAEAARAQVARVLQRIPGRTPDDAPVVLDSLVERSGMLREASPGSIDFLHNTFKEFLAGERFADQAHVGLLAKRVLADDPTAATWRRVALFAVAGGDPSFSFASDFVREVLDLPPAPPADPGKKPRRPRKEDPIRARNLFALQCRAVATYLDRDLIERLDGLLTELFPPRTLPDAEQLATCGDVAVPHLKRRPRIKAREAAASVRALRLINTRQAHEVLQQYLGDDRLSVMVELAQAVNPLTIPAVQELMRRGEALPDGIREQVDDLSPLSGLAGLQALDLRGTAVVDLAPLSGLSGLRTLDLRYAPVANLVPLSGLAGLQALNLRGTAVVDLAPLSGLGGLQALSLRNTKVADLAPLSGLGGLRSLDLRVTEVHDLAPLSGLSGLQTLDLGGIKAADLAPLSGLTGLQALDLEVVAVHDLKPLSGLAALRTLNLRGTAITDLASLSGLTALQVLNLRGIAVSDLAPLSRLAGLQVLNLIRTEVVDLAPLSGLAGLQVLELEGTAVSDLTPLSGLTGLQALNLRETAVSDLGALSGLTGLQTLSLAGTKVADLGALSGLGGLQTLYLGENHVLALEPLSGLESLRIERVKIERDSAPRPPRGTESVSVAPGKRGRPAEEFRMKIDRVAVANFRGFERETFLFPREVTVLTGDNGTGKTSILEALAVGLGAFCGGFDGGDSRPLGDEDVRRVRSERTPGAPMEPRDPASVRCAGTVAGEEIEWVRTRQPPGTTRDGGEPDRPGILARELQRRAREGDGVPLPVVAYYSAGRPWLGAEGAAGETPGPRTRGYAGCLDPTPRTRDLLLWFKTRELQALRQGQAPPDLAAVRAAVSDGMGTRGSVGWDVAADELLGVFADGGRLPFRLLSDGVRAMLALLADIARRAATLNPHLGADAPRHTPGVVLIDDIDLHLHPRWQRRVMEDLRRAFPLMQFVATAHSPFIVQSLRPGELINLDRDEPETDGSRKKSIEDIVEDETAAAGPMTS